MSSRNGKLTEVELRDIALRCNAARPEPWTSFIEGRDHQAGSSFIMVGESDSGFDDIELIGSTNEDQDFIAHARQDVPKIIAEIRRLRAILSKTKS